MTLDSSDSFTQYNVNNLTPNLRLSFFFEWNNEIVSFLYNFRPTMLGNGP